MLDISQLKFDDRGLIPAIVVDAETNALLIDYMTRRGVTDGYWQDVDAATADMIPDFDGTGV